MTDLGEYGPSIPREAAQKEKLASQRDAGF